MIIPGGQHGGPEYRDTKPWNPLQERLNMWTPRELIESLEKWNPDEPIELVVQNVSGSNPGPYIGLAQGLNSINLSGKD